MQCERHDNNHAKPSALSLIDTKNPRLKKVMVHLPNGDRVIGLLDYSKGSGQFITKRTEANILRVMNGIGLNLELLKSEDIQFDRITITLGTETFICTRQEFLDNSRAYFFKNQGYEKQLFIRLEDLRRLTREHIGSNPKGEAA